MDGFILRGTLYNPLMMPKVYRDQRYQLLGFPSKPGFGHGGPPANYPGMVGTAAWQI
jgi:hypothetical protein